MLSALIAAASTFGPSAVAWVIANQSWLIPLGPVAFYWISKLFGN